MRKQLALLVVGLVTALVAAGELARASTGRTTPQDTQPYWSSDARDVVFAEDESVLATPAGRGPVQTVGIGRPRGFEPGGAELLVESGGEFTVTSTSGTPIRVIGGSDPAWSPDGRIAYLDGTLLRVVDATGANNYVIARQVEPPSWDLTGPVWSPDGTRVVIASGSGLVLADADGSGAKTIFAGANQSVNPTWSPDGSLIAFERNAGAHWEIWTVRPDGSDVHELLGSASANYRYPRFSPTSGRLAFISDRQHVPGAATRYQFALYSEAIGGLRPAKLIDDVHPFSPPAWSPTGAQVAAAAGQECLRWGIYVVRDEAQPAGAHRRSNQCRFEGTGKGEILNGTPWHDIVRGFGGNDAIYAGSGNDRIEGDDGTDVISAGPGDDVIFGGNGNDRIFAGSGNDLVIGGDGADRIDCGPGDDTVEGAGPLDVIARNCEHVRH